MCVYIYIKHVVLKESFRFSFHIILSQVGSHALSSNEGAWTIDWRKWGFYFLAQLSEVFHLSFQSWRLSDCYTHSPDCILVWKHLEQTVSPGLGAAAQPQCCVWLCFFPGSWKGLFPSLVLLLITMLCWRQFSSLVCQRLHLHEVALKHKSFPITILT